VHDDAFKFRGELGYKLKPDSDARRSGNVKRILFIIRVNRANESLKQNDDDHRFSLEMKMTQFDNLPGKLQ